MIETAARAETRLIPRAVRAAAMVMFVILSISVGLVAIGSGTGLIPLPYEMFVLAKRMPFVFKAHMVTGAIVLLLAPIVIAVRHDARLHRMLGRVVGAFVVAAGLTAFPVAIMSDSSIAARAGFFAQGMVWLYLLVRGVAAIRGGDRQRHAHMMLAMVAVTSGAIWFRVLIGSAILLDLPFAAVYAAAAWMGWIIPLAIVLAWPRLTHHLTSRPPVRRPSPGARPSPVSI